MRRYRVMISVDDDIEAKTIDEALRICKARMEIGYYGPTYRDIEDMGEVVEEVNSQQSTV